MKTQYFKAENRSLTVKLTNKSVYTRVLTKRQVKEIKHKLPFFGQLRESYKLIPCTYAEFLTVGSKELLSKL